MKKRTIVSYSTDEEDEEEIKEEIKYEEANLEIKSENGDQAKAQVSSLIFSIQITFFSDKGAFT